jgi:hypothetical protein
MTALLLNKGPTRLEPIRLAWRKFSRLTEARLAFAKISCVYVQTDPAENPIRSGKASEGLEARYRGGTGYALDAAMHGSGNFVFVAAVPKEVCEAVEAELIWQGRRQLMYNNNGKIGPPSQRLELVHGGTRPNYERFDIAKPGRSPPH